MVPTASMLCMGLSLLASVGIPIGLFIFFKKRAGLSFTPVAMGALGFFVSALLLEQMLHSAVLGRFPDLSKTRPGLFVLYGILAAGVFEETGRFAFLMYMRKKHPGAGTGLAYGIGHGGLESVLFLGLNMFSALAVSFSINSGAPDSSITPETISYFISSPSLAFLWGALERVSAVAMHVSLSAMVWIAVTKRGKVWLYPVAIGLHALVNIPAAMAQAEFLESTLLIETFTLLFAAFCVYAAWKAVSLYSSSEPSYDASAPEPAPPPVQEVVPAKTFTALDYLNGSYEEKDPWQDSDNDGVIDVEGHEKRDND